MRCDMKRKHRAEPATAESIDPNVWLRYAHAANDDEAVAWSARIHETNTNQEEQTQKRRRLDGDARRWEHYLTASDKLAQEHAQRARDTYYNAQASELTRRHLRKLRTLYANTLTAKTEYHLLVSNLIEEQIAVQRLHKTYTTMCLERRQLYEQAKHDIVKWYADVKTSLHTYNRYERMCTDTNMLLAHHMRHAHYMWRQQEHIMNLTQGFNNNCKQKTTQYWDASRQTRQTIYLIRKRPREQWDPTLWEVPLQPLPKRHKAHWDPNEWEIPLTLPDPPQQENMGAQP